MGTEGLTANGYGVSFIRDDNVLKLVNKHNNKNSHDTEGQMGCGGRQTQEGGGICMHIAGSSSCMEETNTTL